MQQPSDTNLLSILGLVCDPGEAEAIALARQLNTRVILDDHQARGVAKRLNLKIIGTVGILVLAKQSGVVHVLRPILKELANSGFYLSAALIDDALRIVGE